MFLLRTIFLVNRKNNVKQKNNNNHNKKNGGYIRVLRAK